MKIQLFTTIKLLSLLNKTYNFIALERYQLFPGVKIKIEPKEIAVSYQDIVMRFSSKDAIHCKKSDWVFFNSWVSDDKNGNGLSSDDVNEMISILNNIEIFVRNNLEKLLTDFNQNSEFKLINFSVCYFTLTTFRIIFDENGKRKHRDIPFMDFAFWLDRGKAPVSILE